MKSHFRRLISAAVLVTMVAVDARAQTQPGDLALASLEDLLNVEITIAGHRKQTFDTIPAAVFVLTTQDIRRSGATTLPDALRLIPGVSVAQVASNFWAISVRGLSGILANKLLVLVDGRTIYNSTFAGINWSVEGVFLDDVERVEVVRGPGGAVWGANAMNGVINIITKSANDTQGGMVIAGIGEGGRGAVRYGGVLGAATYRVYVQSMKHSSLELDDASAGDGWWNALSGGRLDWTQGPDSVTVEGSYAQANTQNPQAPESVFPLSRVDYHSGNGNATWTHTRSENSAIEVTSFFNVIHNDLFDYPSYGTGFNSERSAEVAANYHTKVFNRHAIVVGGGFRSWTSKIGVASAPPSSNTTARIVSLFGQDEIALSGHVNLTVGSRFEHDSRAEWTAQPTARAMWNLGRAQQRLWFAVSHAVRTASGVDVGGDATIDAAPVDGLPVAINYHGLQTYQPERFDDLEAGYRVSVGRSLTLDVTAFKGRYHDLPLSRQGAPMFVDTPPHLVINLQTLQGLQIATRGIEIAWKWKPADAFGVDGSYSGLRQASELDPASLDVDSGERNWLTPTHQWQLRPWLSLGRTALSGALFRVGEIPQRAIGSYVRIDAKIDRDLGQGMKASLVGENLLGAHVEAAGDFFTPTPFTLRAPRRVMVQLDWRFAK